MKPDDELHQVELAYEIRQKWWNQGFMTEATKRHFLVYKTMKNILDIVSIIGYYYHNNRKI